jgi:hypothetical protein
MFNASNKRDLCARHKAGHDASSADAVGMSWFLAMTADDDSIGC